LLEVICTSEPIEATSPCPITVRIVNDGTTPIELDKDDMRWEIGKLAIQVVYEDGWKCRFRGAVAEGGDNVPKVVVGPGEKVEVVIDIQSLVECGWPGTYHVRVGRDPAGSRGHSARTEWAQAMRVVLKAPSADTVSAQLGKCPADLPWRQFNLEELRRLSAVGGWAASSRFRDLCERLERDTRDGVKVAEKVADEIRFGEERIRILELARSEKWTEVRAYLKESNRKLPLRRELQSFLRAAFAKRLAPEKGK
jgi:hypothetical protein